MLIPNSKQSISILIYLLFLPFTLFAASLSSLYSTLDPSSISQHFAFYELYPDTKEGREALYHAWDLLSGGHGKDISKIKFPKIDLRSIIALVNRPNDHSPPILKESELLVIEKLASHLPNRKLKGFGILDPKTLIQLDPEEIDLARGLLLAEASDQIDPLKIRSYEAIIDLMALQILARLTPDSRPQEKIRAINDYIFSEQKFRFPAHSLYAKDIDLFTFLPSVIDSRRGVCLGVSILYLSLAQRLNLSLEAITPPGHIYVRYRSEKNEIINIETTARGIDVPCDMYLSIETATLPQRNLKEVIGLAFMNQAAVAWQKEDHKKSIQLYEKGLAFLPQDPLIRTFLGYQYLFIHEEDKGKKLLKEAKQLAPTSQDFITDDFLEEKANAEGIHAIYMEVDETRNSILKKQKLLETILQKKPSFRGALFHLAITYLQLNREKEAIPILEKYMSIDQKNPVVCYYLAVLYFQRLHYNAAWKYFTLAEELVHSNNHFPKALIELKSAIQQVCPEPKKNI